MSDLIKREDALRALVDTDEIKGYAYVALEERLQEIPAVQPPVKAIGRIEVDMDEIFERVNDVVRRGEWIPCNRRLPEEGVVVLVCMDIKGHKFDWEEQRCIEFGRISSDRYDIDGTGWEWLNESGADFWEPGWNNNILAWMPLPEPWKGADYAKEGI